MTVAILELIRRADGDVLWMLRGWLVEQPPGKLEFSANGEMDLNGTEPAPLNGSLDLSGLPW